MKATDGVCDNRGMWELVVSGTVPVAASLLTLTLTNRHTRKLASEERQARTQEDERKRKFAAGENRYEDRRDAVIALDKAVSAELDRIVDFEDSAARRGYDLSPGDVHEEEPRFAEVNAARAAVVLLASDDVAKAATDLTHALVLRNQGESEAFRNAQAIYQQACRVMLRSSTPSFE